MAEFTESQLARAVRRIARRFEPAVAEALLFAVERALRGVGSIEALMAALSVAAVDARTVESVLYRGADLATLIRNTTDLEQQLLLTLEAGAIGTASQLSRDLGADFAFRRFDPNSVQVARSQTGTLIQRIADDTLDGIRQILALGQLGQLTTRDQARAIQGLVGLPRNWAQAPTRLELEILAGDVSSATRRRLSGVDKAKIRAAVKAGTNTEAFAQEMALTYRERLRRARAANIARTETREAANEGQRLGWKQAVQDGLLPQGTRRFAVVTDDNRLRPEHAAIPGLNPAGVGMDEPFRTPLGPRMSPPFDPNCRCGQTILTPDQQAQLAELQ